MGYRRIRDELDGHKGIHVNDKRVLRICRKYDIKSNIKWIIIMIADFKGNNPSII